MTKKHMTIKNRIAGEKANVLEQLKKTPIVQLAVKNAGIGRATYYNWCKKDKKFAQAAQEAMRDGYLFVNDIAESQLFTLIKEKKLEAIRLWLRHHHPTYAEKIEIVGNISHTHKLTSEQKATMRKALSLANLNKKTYVEHKKQHKITQAVRENNKRSDGKSSNSI